MTPSADHPAEWVPVTPAVAAAVEKLPPRADVPEMVERLAALGVKLPPEFLRRDRDTMFPWSNIITTGDDADKWRRYEGMRRKLASARFVNPGPLPVSAEIDAASTEAA